VDAPNFEHVAASRRPALARGRRTITTGAGSQDARRSLCVSGVRKHLLISSDVIYSFIADRPAAHPATSCWTRLSPSHPSCAGRGQSHANLAVAAPGQHHRQRCPVNDGRRRRRRRFRSNRFKRQRLAAAAAATAAGSDVLTTLQQFNANNGTCSASCRRRVFQQCFWHSLLHSIALKVLNILRRQKYSQKTEVVRTGCRQQCQNQSPCQRHPKPEYDGHGISEKKSKKKTQTHLNWSSWYGNIEAHGYILMVICSSSNHFNSLQSCRHLAFIFSDEWPQASVRQINQTTTTI